MLSTRLATAVALTGLAAAVLTGCSSNPSSDTGSKGTKASTNSSTVVRTKPEHRRIKVVAFDSPTEVQVTPVSSSDALFGKTFTLDIDALQVPAAGECGAEESVALAKTLISPDATWFLDYGSVSDDVYVDAKGVHHGSLTKNAGDYGQTMLQEGMATLDGPAPFEYFQTAQDAAKSAKTGLWGSCPDFGA